VNKELKKDLEDTSKEIKIEYILKNNLINIFINLKIIYFY
jgi:hypothetical protein